MNEISRQMLKQIFDIEHAVNQDKDFNYRLGFHLMPHTGWMNDPNGLCYFNGYYHIFFQYSPFDVNGGLKMWGHYRTKNFLDYEYLGTPILPDAEYDKNGVFSGSTFVDDKGLHIFYTGNVELEGDYDYTYTGRRADTIYVHSKDGLNFSAKQVVIDTDDYPVGYSCHIRDPKVWFEQSKYYMVLGARTKHDIGQILLYESIDLHNWNFVKALTTKNKMAYMWECPDLFPLGDKYVLSFSPQGIKTSEFQFQNIYHSGYFISEKNPVSNNFMYDESTFREWDMGFDFYAPQTFYDGNLRRILIGWVGLPGSPYTYKEVEENWQHCLTVPRELSIRKSSDGNEVIFQYPIKEWNQLRNKDKILVLDKCIDTKESLLDIICEDVCGDFVITIDQEMILAYHDKVLELKLSKKCGLGRDSRKCIISNIHHVRILIDVSVLEIYINKGEIVFTTRYYSNMRDHQLIFQMDYEKAYYYSLKPFVIQ